MNNGLEMRNIMNKKTYFIIAFAILPVYLFGGPVITYLKNFDKITYSLQIPSYNIDQTDKPGSTYNSISNIDNIKIIESKVQSWIVTFPDLTKDDEKKFKKLLSEIGIQSIIKTKDNIIAIGPFIDKSMAETLSKKVQSYAGYSGQLQMINN